MRGVAHIAVWLAAAIEKMDDSQAAAVAALAAATPIDLIDLQTNKVLFSSGPVVPSAPSPAAGAAAAAAPWPVAVAAPRAPPRTTIWTPKGLIQIVLPRGANPRDLEVGPLPEPLLTYMIGNRNSFDAAAPQMKELGLTPFPVDPVVVDSPPELAGCSRQQARPLGIWRAHARAWERVAASKHTGLVLEDDWTLANQSAATVKQKLLELRAMLEASEAGLAWLGTCDGGAYCATAYFLAPWLARRLLSVDPCDVGGPVDRYMRGPHGCGGKGTYCYDTPIPAGVHRGVGIFGDGWFLQNRNARAEFDGREELRVEEAADLDPERIWKKKAKPASFRSGDGDGAGGRYERQKTDDPNVPIQNASPGGMEDEDEVEDLEPEEAKWLDLEPEEDGTLRMPDRPLAPTGLPHFRK